MEASGLGVVLDASAAIALLREEPGAGTVEELLRSEPARMSTVNAAEAVDILIRRHGGQPDEVIARVGELLESALEPVPSTLERAIRAGELRARHFRRDQRISLADCFVLATAEPSGRIATGDATLAAVAGAEGIGVIALPGPARPRLHG